MFYFMTESFDLFSSHTDSLEMTLLHSRTTSKNKHGGRQRIFSATDDAEERTSMPKMTL